MKPLITLIVSIAAAVGAFIWSKNYMLGEMSLGNQMDVALGSGINWTEVAIYAGAVVIGLVAFSLAAFVCNKVIDAVSKK